MIIRSHSIANIWIRSAFACGFFLSFSLVLFWVALSEVGYGTDFKYKLFLVPLFMAGIFTIMGTNIRSIRRLRYYSLIVGALIILPLYFLVMSPMLIYFTIFNVPICYGLIFCIVYFLSFVVWYFFNISSRIKSAKKIDYFSRETTISADGSIILNGDKASDLDVLLVKFGKNKNIKSRWAVPFFCYIGSIEFPLQRVIFSYGGAKSIFLVLGFLSWPISRRFQEPTATRG